MSDEPWEAKLFQRAEDHGVTLPWDETTELVAMVSDDMYPSVLKDEVRETYAAELVLFIAMDDDYRRCIEAVMNARRPSSSDLGDTQP